MRAEPFVCYRPQPEKAKDFASLPYDVFTREEAREAVAKRPHSFLAIDRPETAFDPSHVMHAPDVYQKAASLLADRVADGTLVRDGDPCCYLYRLSGNGHEQTGIVAAFSVDDYESGTIRRHEFTRPVDEKDRADHVPPPAARPAPCFSPTATTPRSRPSSPPRRRQQPLYDFTDAEVCAETVARQQAGNRRRPAHDARACPARLHRRWPPPCGCGRARALKSLREEHGDTMGAPGTEPCDYLLAVLFPESQLMTLPYDRVVADTAGLSADELLARLAEQGFSVGEPVEGPVRPTDALHYGLFLGGTWRELAWQG